MEQGTLSTISKDINEIKITLAVNTESLLVHVKRTDLLEQSVDRLKKISYMVAGALSLVGLLGTVATITDVFIKIYHH